MSATVLYMSMSLDGFVAGPNEDRKRLKMKKLKLKDAISYDSGVALLIHERAES